METKQWHGEVTKFPVTSTIEGPHFFVKHGKDHLATPLLLALTPAVTCRLVACSVAGGVGSGRGVFSQTVAAWAGPSISGFGAFLTFGRSAHCRSCFFARARRAFFAAELTGLPAGATCVAESGEAAGPVGRTASFVTWPELASVGAAVAGSAWATPASGVTASGAAAAGASGSRRSAGCSAC